MNSELEYWTAHANRLSYLALFRWVFLLNLALLFSIGLGAGCAYVLRESLSSTLLPMVGFGIFVPVFWFLLRYLKTQFYFSRRDLSILSDGEVLVFKKILQTIGEEKISAANWTCGSVGSAHGMAFEFHMHNEKIVVGCDHPQFKWVEAFSKKRVDYILAPSDFMRLIGEIGLEGNVVKKG